MKKTILALSFLMFSLLIYSEATKINRELEESLIEDYDQNIRYSLYEKTFQNRQEFLHNTVSWKGKRIQGSVKIKEKTEPDKRQKLREMKGLRDLVWKLNN